MTAQQPATEALELVREAREHVQQAYEWHLDGSHPTGQSVRLQDALQLLDAILASANRAILAERQP